jgi:hypothetical protein
MILKALLFSVFQFFLLAVISLAVAGIIRLIYMAIHHREAPDTKVK